MKFFLLALTASSALSASPASTRLEVIDAKIQALEAQIHAERIHAINEEMEAQPYMRYMWDRFSQEMTLSTDAEKHVLEMKKELSRLQQERSELQTQKTSTP